MTKRHLSEQQIVRIKALQADAAGDAVRVIAQLGRNIIIETEDGEQCQVKLRQNLPPLVTGDWVVLQSENSEPVVTQLLPRSNLIERPVKAGKLKPVAANIDQILLMLACNPTPNALMLDRYLIHLEALNIPIVLLFNKSDLGVNTVEPLLAIYQALNYNIQLISCQEAQLESVAHVIKDKSNILLGPSGVGKSSLVNALEPDLNARIGEVSENYQGKHTTTTSRLYVVGEGEIIDSPGVYDIASWHLSPDEIRKGFIEFKDYNSTCQFNDCSHTHEPKCGVKDALEAGKISPLRYEHYCLILQGE